MDLNGDGYDDIISGSWPGQMYIFKGAADGTFAPAEKLRMTSGADVQVGSASAVYAFDWNNNGLLDLLIGNINGEVFFVPNEGSATEPKFGKGVGLLVVAGARVAGGDAGPCVADWDGDGRPDLIVGTGAGSVVWFRNVGSHEKPHLGEMQTLIPASTMRYGVNAQVDSDQPWGSRLKVTVVDYNNDGLLDLLVGDFSYSTPGETEQAKSAREKLEARRIEIENRLAEMHAQGERGEAQREALAELRTTQLRLLELSRAQQYPTVGGTVWFFERLPTAE